MAEVGTAFLTAGVILVVGFIASYLFMRTRFPDVIALMVLGLVLGPLNRSLLHISAMNFISDPASLSAVTPYIIGLAICLVLFDAGLNFPLTREGGSALFGCTFSVMTMVLSIGLTTLVAVAVLGYPLLVALLLGMVLSGISSAVVVGVVRHIPLSREGSKYLQVEAVVTDILGILLAVALVQMLAGGLTAEAATWTFLLSLGIGVLGGILIGVVWRSLWRAVRDIPYACMLTIAVLVLVYGLVESLGGSGAAASLLFGLILGHTGRDGTERYLTSDIKDFCGELTFFARTFFFVMLGLLFSLSAVSDIGRMLVALILIIPGLVVVRRSTAFLASRFSSRLEGEQRVLTLVMARGLGAAMLASLPFHIGEYMPGHPYHTLMAPFEGEFIDITFIVVAASIVLTTMAAGMHVSELSPDDAPSS